MMKQIVFFGDSLTAGYGLQSVSTQSFPSILQQKISTAGYPYKVINAGISGDTTTSGLARLDQVLEYSADIFVIALGANDMLRGHAPGTMAANINQIITRVSARFPDAKLLVLGMELPEWITDARASEYRQLYRKIGKDHDIAFLPFLLEGVAGISNLNMADGIHPNARGYQIIAENVWPVLKTLLED